MKKIFLLFCLIININVVYAIENIEIDNENLVPKFNKDIKVYNYFTNKEKINLYVKKSDNEVTSNDSEYILTNNKTKIIVTSSNNEIYEINVFKNYKKDINEEVYLENLTINGYDIDFDKEKYEYTISINEEDNLNINYELSNAEAYVSVEGNGNFNKTDNIIKINVNNDKEYIIHAYKTINVSNIEKSGYEKEMSESKKEIVKLIIITISCVFVFIFYYSLFINKSTLHI